MQMLPFERSSIAQWAAVSLATLAAVALLGLVLAYWTWEWFAPRAEPRVEAIGTQGSRAASANGLFGTAPRNQDAAAPTGIAIRLLGIVAASGGRRGYGVVQLDGKQILATQEGEDIAPGIRLAEVLTDRLILEHGGVREALAWPEKKSALSSAPVPASTVSQPRQAPTAAPQGRSTRRRSARAEQD